MRAFKLFGIGAALVALVVSVIGISVESLSFQPYTVCPSGCPFSKIQAALDAAKDGDTITVGPGVYGENLTITKSVSLVSADPNQVLLLPGGPAYALIQVGEESTLGVVRIEGFTLQQAAGLVGQAIYTEVDSSIQGFIFRNNRVLNYEDYDWQASLAGSEVIVEKNFFSINSSLEVDGQYIRVVQNDLWSLWIRQWSDGGETLVEGNTFREGGLGVAGDALVRGNRFLSASLGIGIGGDPFEVELVQVLENESIGPGISEYIAVNPDNLAIGVGPSGDRVLIENNKIANYDIGISISGDYQPPPETIIRKNIIRQGRIGIQLDEQSREPTKIHIIENIIEEQQRPSEMAFAGAGILIYRFVEQVEVLLQGNTLRLGDFGVLLMPGSGKFEFQGNTITDNDLFGVLLAVPPCGEVVDPAKVQVTGSGNEIANNGKQLPPEVKALGDGEGNVCPKELISLKK